MESADWKKLDYEKFEAEFKEIFDAWKATWAPIGHHGHTVGPRKVAAATAIFLGEEHRKALQPEQEEYKKVIDYVATALIIATRFSEFDGVMQVIHKVSEFELRKFQYEFMKDILKEVTARLTKSAEGGPKPEIREIVEACRAKLGKAVNFGIVDPETSSG